VHATHATAGSSQSRRMREKEQPRRPIRSSTVHDVCDCFELAKCHGDCYSCQRFSARERQRLMTPTGGPLRYVGPHVREVASSCAECSRSNRSALSRARRLFKSKRAHAGWPPKPTLPPSLSLSLSAAGRAAAARHTVPVPLPRAQDGFAWPWSSHLLPLQVSLLPPSMAGRAPATRFCDARARALPCIWG
jgi:hypothetical protein